MNPPASSFKFVLSINVKLLLGTMFGWLAWTIWPNSPEWWGMGLFSIMFGISSFRLVVEAVTLMARLYHRDKAIAAYLAQAVPAKSSEMATDESLRNAGMR